MAQICARASHVDQKGQAERAARKKSSARQVNQIRGDPCIIKCERINDSFLAASPLDKQTSGIRSKKETGTETSSLDNIVTLLERSGAIDSSLMRRRHLASTSIV